MIRRWCALVVLELVALGAAFGLGFLLRGVLGELGDAGSWR